MSLATEAIADFDAFITIYGNTSLTHTRTGTGTATTISRSLALGIKTRFGVDSVPCYQTDSFVTRFASTYLSTAPKLGDTITRNAVVYEVVDVQKLVELSQWRLECTRAYLNSDYSTTCTIKRATVGQTAAGVDNASLSNFATGVACYLYGGFNQHVEDVLDVIGVQDNAILYMATASGVRASDVIVLGGVNYEITKVEKDGRIAQLPECSLRRLQ